MRGNRFKSELPPASANSKPQTPNSKHSLMSPTLIYIFGGTGDLAHRKLIPALFN
ncbi:MAG: hypothetical protein EOO11_21040, partial [Chitinophagaceae bacterium]